MRKKILFIASTHGDEQVGKWLWNTNPQGYNDYCSWQVIVGNPHAMSLGRRFVDQDLNRVYHNPDFTSGYEVTRIQELESVIQQYDVVYDIHQTTPTYPMPDCVFINAFTALEQQAIQHCSAQYVILDDNPAYSGHFVTSPARVGITLEYGRSGNYAEETKRLNADFQRIITNTPAKTKQIFMRTHGPVDWKFKDLKLKDFAPLTTAQKKTLSLNSAKTYYPVFVNHIGNDCYCFLNEEIE